jgi:ketosteroid isomerase-like protein
MLRISLLCLTALMFTACASRSTSTSSDPELEKTITTLLNEIAANTSARDVQSNLHLIPKTDKVVYVSDGIPITGNEYAKELGESYASRSQMSFHWDKLEITPIGDNTAAVTGWATASVTPIGGQPVSGRYIFTMVFANDGTGWKRIIAQKSVLKEDS